MLHRFLLLSMFLIVAGPSSAEEIPLTSCDGLPLVQVGIGGTKVFFLVDTAATSMLNLKSFAFGEPKKIAVRSWSGTEEAKGQKVTISDLMVGEHHLRKLTLSAVDLSAIGHACGQQIDGILGVDVLRRLGAVLDLNARVAQLRLDSETAQARVDELDERLALCARAFDLADEEVFADCLDPNVVLFTEVGDFYGREAAMKYYRRMRSGHHSPGQTVIRLRRHHLLEEAIWVEYELHGSVEQRVIVSRGTALCRKTEGTWRILHLNSSAPPDDVAFASQ